MEKLVKERDMRLLRERIRKGTYDVKDLLYLMVAGDTFAQIDSTSGVKFDSDEVEMEKYIQNQYRRRSKMLVGVPGEIANILYNKYHMRSGLHKFDLTN
jgi:hypothetical protein